MRRTPAQISRWLDQYSPRMDLPAQFLGNEPNARRKDWDTAAVRWCLVASWPYEQAAGNSSIPAVYAAINDAPPGNYLADRFYLPATPRDLRMLQRDRIGAFGIETKHPLLDFDVVGSSISYPVLSMSYLKLLTCSAIPARWRERDPNTHPMVIVGGQCYGAPEVLAPVVDCWWLGEVEDEPDNPGISAVCAAIARYKHDGAWHTDRVSCYADLARTYPFLYFPRFVDTHYRYEDRSHVGVRPHPSKQVAGYTCTLDGMRLPLRRRIVKNLDNAAPLVAPPLLYADPAMGSGDLEVGRGCPAWCSFCALSWRQKPYRQRSVDNVLSYAGEFARNMGSVRLAPFSPDFPMYTQRKKLIAGLLENVCDEVDAATMRVDDFIADNEFMLLQVHGGMDAVTLGVEGNSQRMRDLVGKGTSDADICDAVARGIRAGIRRFKLYMISNLPGEDEGDVFRILRLAGKLADIRDGAGRPGVRIQFSWTPLLVEANTPFQWFAPTVANRVLGDVWEELRGLGIDFKVGSKAEPNKLAFFQLCQRASRDVGEALVDAMLEVDQACWGGVPRHFRQLLDDKLRERGFHNGLADCFDERDRGDMFGWEHIDQGMSVAMLWQAYVQMREFIENTDSHTYDEQFDERYHGQEWIMRCDERCYGKRCGACDHTDLKHRQGYLKAVDTPVDLSTLRPVDQRSMALRVRLRLDRPARLRYVDNSHWRFAVRRAALRAQHILGVQVGITKRSIRFASDEVKGRDWTHGVDYVEFGLTRLVPAEQVAAFINAMTTELAPWLQVGGHILLPAAGTTLRVSADTHLYQIDLDTTPEAAAARVAAFTAAAHVPMRLPVVGGYFAPTSEDVNAHDYVRGLWLARDRHQPLLRMLLHGRPSPYHVYTAVMGRASWLDVAHLPARRLEVYLPTDGAQQDFTRPVCQLCLRQIPTTLLDIPAHDRCCPRCADTHSSAGAPA